MRVKLIAAGLALALAPAPLLAQATGPQGLAEPKLPRAAEQKAGPKVPKGAPVTTPATSVIPPPRTAENTLNIQLSTGGVVSIQLRPDKAPLSVAQIRTLAGRHFYDGLTFHRVIDGFMAQGGDPKGDGSGESDLPDVKAEFNELPHVRGAMAMARTEDPNSANSQFYIMLSPNLALDNRYTVIGRVFAGMAYVDAIEKGEPPANPTRMVRVWFGDPPANPATPPVAAPAPAATNVPATLPSGPLPPR